MNYEERDGHFDTIKRAKLTCENYIEEEMFTGTLESTPSIFNMKNNFGWIEKQEIAQTNTNFDVVDFIRTVEERNAAIRNGRRFE